MEELFTAQWGKDNRRFTTQMIANHFINWLQMSCCKTNSKTIMKPLN